MLVEQLRFFGSFPFLRTPSVDEHADKACETGNYYSQTGRVFVVIDQERPRPMARL